MIGVVPVYGEFLDAVDLRHPRGAFTLTAMTSWTLITALADAETPLLQGDRATRIQRSAASATDAAVRFARQRARSVPRTPDVDTRGSMGFTWLPMIFAVVGLAVLPINSLSIDPKIITAAICAAVAAIASIPISIASIASRRSDESHSFQLAAALGLAGISVALVFLSRDPLAGRIPQSGIPVFIAVTATVVIAACTAPQFIIQRRRRRQIDDFLRSRPDSDEAIAEQVARALSANGVTSDDSADARWRAAVKALPHGSPLADLCARYGIGVGIVWRAAHPNGDAVSDALEASTL